MLNFRRGLTAAALLAVLMTGAPALAQQTNTVGPAELRDFRLPGERTTPPAPAPAQTVPQPTPQPERPAATPPPPAAERTPAPVRSTPAPAATTPRPADRTPAPAASTPAPQAQPETPDAPAAAQPVPGPQLPVTLEPPVANGQQPSAPAAPAPEQGGGWSWAWLAVPAGLALLAFLFLRNHRREAEPEEEIVEQAEAEAPAPRPEAVAAGASARRLAQMPAQGTRNVTKPALKLPPKVRAVPAAPQAPPQPTGPRAVIEVEFIPARASATAEAATVEFELVLKNVGEIPAGNIRIDTRMFNASATKEMAEFLKGPIHDVSGSPHVTIEPGDELRLQSAMAMPTQDVREILMQGQRLFVPAVASVVAWDWGSEGRERVSLSWLVGRETEDRAAKMGAFRLDLGPRIYRQVGVRPLKLVA
jgi:hypothetical protein